MALACCPRVAKGVFELAVRHKDSEHSRANSRPSRCGTCSVKLVGVLFRCCPMSCSSLDAAGVIALLVWSYALGVLAGCHGLF